METLPKFLLNKYRLQVGVVLVVAVVVGGGALALASSRPRSPEIQKVEETSTSVVPSKAQEKIKVAIAGAVVHPGVCEILKDGRVEDALDAAGGLSEQADRDWVSKNLNLAAKLSDGDKLYIPKMGEMVSAPTPAPLPPPAGIVSGVETPSGGEPSKCSRVNINNASADTLADCLSGIGTTKAQSIVKYREDHGGFKSIEEIKNVSGIAEGTFAKIKGQITVD